MISIITLEQADKWDEIVKSFREHDVYYLSGYVKAYQINGDGEPQLFYFEKEKTKAINVVIKRDIAECHYFETMQKNTYFDIVTPYGYGGWIIEGDDYALLQREYEEYCHKSNIVSEFVRYSPLLENWHGFEKMYDQVHLGSTVFVDTTSAKVVWENITSKNRNMIRKAQKNGVRVYWGRTPELIEPFMSIYNTTMDRDNADEYYYFGRNYYERVLEDLKQNAMWFYTEKDNDIASIAIFMFCNGNMHYHLSASKKEYQSLAPSNLMIYEAAVWAAEHGYKKLHLGGGLGSEKDSLYKFKKAFNRQNDSEFYIGKKIFNQEAYMELCEIRKNVGDGFDPNNSFFPGYRK